MTPHPSRLPIALILAAMLLSGTRTPVNALPDGDWAQVPPSAYTSDGPQSQNHRAIYDPIRDRMLTFGGDIAGFSLSNQVSELRFAGPALWRVLTVSGTPPSKRSAAAVAYDPIGDRMIVLGGATNSGTASDVWSLSLSGAPTWQQLSPTGTSPPARTHQAMIYDAPRRRMMVFSGYPASADVWCLNLDGAPSWTLLTPAGTPPSARSYSVAVYDAVRERMIVHGGFAASIALSDMYALTLTGTPTWSLLVPASGAPSARAHHAAVYDSVHDAVLLFGGWIYGDYLNDAWSYSPSTNTWQALSPASRPTARSSFASAFDTQRKRMVIQGGTSGLAGMPRDCWALSAQPMASFTLLTPSATPARPQERWYHAAAYDELRDRMIVHGGFDADGTLWSLDLAGEPVWSAPAAIGTAVPAYQHQMVLDPVRDRLLIIGGTASLSNVPVVSLTPAPSWSTLATAGTPPAPDLRRPTAIYDPIRDRILMFGGIRATNESVTTQALWELTMSDPPTWTELAPSGPLPISRAYHTAIYDPAGDRMLVFGGYTASGFTGAMLDDSWQLSLAGIPTWSQLSIGNSGPGPRMGHTAVLDAERSRMLVYTPDAPSDTVWALNLSGAESWSALLPAAGPQHGRSWHVAAFDPGSDRMIVFGGLAPGGPALDDAWELRFPDVTGVPPSGRASTVVLHGAIPNPSRNQARIAFTLPDPHAARLEVFDLHGRRIAARDVGGAAGRRSVVIPEMARMPSGLYVLRLEHAGIARSARFVHVP